MINKLYVIIVLFLIAGTSGYSQITPQQAAREMGRGINLGNTLEPPLEGSWNNGPAMEYYFDMYHEAGFTNVRVPVRWDKHTDMEAPFNIDTTWMNRVEQVLDWGLERDMYVVVNAHHEDWLKENYADPNMRARFDSIWSQIATRFQDKPEKLLFEMINEPKGLTQAEINELNERILGIIRRTNPTRIVIYGGHEWSNSGELMSAAIPEDDYIMGYFHSYDPWNFAGEANGTWGTTADINEIISKFETVANWANDHNIPVHLSEFGAMNECHYNSRMHHYATYVEHALNFGFAFSVWDDGGMFRIMGREDSTWNEIKDILMYTYNESPTLITSSEILLNDSTKSNVLLEWTNRTSENDSIIVRKRINNGDFVDYAHVASDATSYTDTVIELENTYYYKLVTGLKDSIVLHSYPTRINILPKVRIPFEGGPITIPGIIEAENYDIGGEGLTYHDSEPENIPGAYRPEEGVDIEEITSGGYHIGYVEEDEWIEYTVNVANAGTYRIIATCASEQSGGQCKVTFPNGAITTINSPNTGGWQVHREVEASNDLPLNAGEQIMRITITASSAFNIDKLVFTDITSVNELESYRFNIFPNPVSNELHIQNTEQSIKVIHAEIFDLAGNQVFCAQNIGKNTIINTSKIKNGYYFVKLKNEKGRNLKTERIFIGK